ncbi:MAG: DUF192 domain-containing protein [Patescibacteria group bacterium]|nr:DUF192 domain-containing protein [Patescibacteria group bacterium]MDD5294845.1 DUF192 domain-containing protein [Patescibacteria group bacterium]MDD5554851.1 DUF192 domain-containing protein [Patescibacteria group bacterium]
MFKKILFLSCLLAVLIIATFLIFFLSDAQNQTKVIKINGAEIKAEIAKTPIEQYRGLSGRDSLCGDCGMLFIFPNKIERTFVMRDMLFPIDIIWIDDVKIVKIDKELPPPAPGPLDLKKYKSGQPVNYVLEVNGGFCLENDIREGDKVEYLK